MASDDLARAAAAFLGGYTQAAEKRRDEEKDENRWQAMYQLQQMQEKRMREQMEWRQQWDQRRFQLQQEASEKMFNERQRQFDLSYGLRREQFESDQEYQNAMLGLRQQSLAQGGSGGGGKPADIDEFRNNILGTLQQQNPQLANAYGSMWTQLQDNDRTMMRLDPITNKEAYDQAMARRHELLNGMYQIEGQITGLSGGAEQASNQPRQQPQQAAPDEQSIMEKARNPDIPLHEVYGDAVSGVAESAAEVPGNAALSVSKMLGASDPRATTKSKTYNVDGQTVEVHDPTIQKKLEESGYKPIKDKQPPKPYPGVPIPQ